jgi:hypothetical protein
MAEPKELKSIPIEVHMPGIAGEARVALLALRILECRLKGDMADSVPGLEDSITRVEDCLAWSISSLQGERYNLPIMLAFFEVASFALEEFIKAIERDTPRGEEEKCKPKRNDFPLDPSLKPV